MRRQSVDKQIQPVTTKGSMKKKTAKDAAQDRAATTEVAVPRLSAEESLRIRDAFNKVDMNHAGTLDGLELRQLFLELGRLDLDPDKEIDVIRRIGTKRKSGVITEADRIDLRATLAFFASRPRPVVTEDEACSKHLFQTLTGGSGEKPNGEKPNDSMVSVQSIDQMLRKSYDLDVDFASFVKVVIGFTCTAVPNALRRAATSPSSRSSLPCNS